MKFIDSEYRGLDLLQGLIALELFGCTKSHDVFELSSCAFQMHHVRWHFCSPILRRHQMKKYDNHVSQSDRKERKEEVVILYSCCLEQFSRVFVSEVIELVESQNACCSKVCPRIVVLEANLLPKFMLQVCSP